MNTGFEQQYLALRNKERRIYSEEEVFHLPEISPDHPHFTEWQLRKESCVRLLKYFEKRKGMLTILEVGCGNGWLAHRLASSHHHYEVTAADINLIELQQAERVFSHFQNLQFVYGSIDSEKIEDKKYDFIVFAASIQYFSSIRGTISRALMKLKKNGEVHIIDSPFYDSDKIEKAKKSTRDYYINLGFPEMTQNYFHHSIDELAPFKYRMLYRPSFIGHHILNNKNPFHWLCIKNEA